LIETNALPLSQATAPPGGCYRCALPVHRICHSLMFGQDLQ